MIRRRIPLQAGFIGISLVVVACALPANQEGFAEGWCVADVEFEEAVTELLEIEDRQAWIESTHAALVEFQEDVRRLPEWTGAQQQVAALETALDDVLDVVETGAAGTEVEDSAWSAAVTALLSAREAVRQAAGGCLVS